MLAKKLEIDGALMSIKEPAPVSPAKFVRLKGVTGTGHFVHAITFVTRKPDPFSKCKCGITVMAGFEGGGKLQVPEMSL